MSLNRIVAEAIEANENEGVINRHDAINVAVPKVLADADLTERCVRGHLSKLVVSSCRKRAKEAAEADGNQASLFGLRDYHNLGGEDGDQKQTVELSRAEFLEIIRIRDEQVLADIAYLNKLRNAERETRDIWQAHPTWTWGDVEREYSRRVSKAA